MPDTWGIPGPTFLVYYIGAIVVVAVIAAVHRRSLFRGRRDTQVDTLGPQQIAYLNGGDRLAIYSAMGGLRAAGAIDSGSFKTLQQGGPLPTGVTPLDNAIYNAAGRRIPARQVAEDQWVKAAIAQLRDGLESTGLAISAATMRTARLWALAGVALVLVGVARLIDGIANGKPFTYLIFAIIGAIILTIRLRAPKRFATDATIKAMTALRARHDHLSPRQSPAYATYGAAGAAKGTWELGLIYQQVEKDALFGQLLDSDFGDGNTDTKGFVIRGGYSVARNWTINASLFLNDLSNDVPQTVTVLNGATPAPYDTTVITGVLDRDYKRLQLDLNFRF